MAIVRSPRPTQHFSIIDNRIIRDGRLSFKARGILLLILSNVDGWRITADDLARAAKDGRTAVLSGLEELRALGYIVTTRKQGADGKWTTESICYDQPQTLPKSGFPTSVFPTSDNPTPLEEPSKNNHNAAEPKGSAVQQLVALYINNYIGEFPPNAAETGKNLKRLLEAGHTPERLAELIPGIASSGRKISQGTLSFEASQQAPKPADAPTPTPPRFNPSEYQKGDPMPANIRELVRIARNNASKGD